MPEENVTREKLAKLERIIQTWISENKFDGNWQIDVLAIEIDPSKGTGVYRFIENVY
jgi:Holliday junction resolvase-like predicted endonuclease